MPLHSFERKDWRGRTPRWRVSMDDARLSRAIEVLEFFMTMKGLWDDPRYIQDLKLLTEAKTKMAAPLVAREDSSYMPLFEGGFYEEG